MTYRVSNFQRLFRIDQMSSVSSPMFHKQNLQNSNSEIKWISKNGPSIMQPKSVSQKVGGNKILSFLLSLPHASLLMDKRCQLVKSHWVLPDVSPHSGRENLFAVSSFNNSQQTGGKQIYSGRCFLWYGGEKNSPWQRLDMEKIFKQRTVLSLEKLERVSLGIWGF